MKTKWKLIILVSSILAFSSIFTYSSASQSHILDSTTSYLPLMYRNYPPLLHKIAFLNWTQTNEQNLYMINDDGSGILNLTNNPTRILYAWSPDGTRIAFSTRWNGNDDIYTMSADGSDLVQLTFESMFDTSPTWSPDGTRIAFASNRDGSWEIYSMTADGSDVTRLTDMTVDAYKPVWSPDGSRIAFTTSLTYSEFEVYVMNVDGSNLTRLTENSSHDRFSDWSPDGLKVLIVSDRDHPGTEGNFDIYVVDIFSLNTLRLTTNGYKNNASWAPMGDKIAYSDYATPRGVFIMNPDGSGKTQLYCSSEPIETSDIAWFADGERIAYTPTSGGTDTLGVYVTNLDGTGCLYLVSLIASSPQWKPGD
jgi:Tol biopolymer transport system component